MRTENKFAVIAVSQYKNLKKSVSLSLATNIERTIWNWMDCHPTEFTAIQSKSNDELAGMSKPNITGRLHISSPCYYRLKNCHKNFSDQYRRLLLQTCVISCLIYSAHSLKIVRGKRRRFGLCLSCCL